MLRFLIKHGAMMGVFLVCLSTYAAGDTKKAESMDGMLYELCRKEMVAGAKQSLNKSKSDPATQKRVLAEIETMSGPVCRCATPKIKAAIAVTISMPEDKVHDYVAKKTKEAMVACM